MGIWDKVAHHQFIDIIEWLDQTRDTMAWRFPRYENEIKNGAKLIVRESQSAALISEGRLGDVYPPGHLHACHPKHAHPLRPDGMEIRLREPVQSRGLLRQHAHISPIANGERRTRSCSAMPTSASCGCAFGTFSIRISDPPTFLRQISGTSSSFCLEGLDDQLREMVGSRFADAVGSSKIAALDLAGNYDQLGRFVSSE